MPKGYFDDYLTSSNDIETKNNINNRISRVMQSNINDKYNKYTNNPQLNNELKIQNFNNLFINNTKNVKKDFRLQTENKIINITYKGIKIKNSRNIINNEIINTINFSFNPKKINFNNEQKENHKSINKTKNVDNNSKNLISLKKLFKFKIIQSKKQKIKENKLLKMYNFDKKYLQWAEIFNKEKKNYSLIDNPNFSIIEYNNQLLKIAYQNFSHESFGPMRKNCYSMNKIINDNAPKCINKWTIFSNKIEFFAPQHLINKLNYFGSSKRIRNRNKLKNNSL